MDSESTKSVSSPAEKQLGQAIRPTWLTRILALAVALISLTLPACNKGEDKPEGEHHNIVVTNPLAKDVVVTQQYVCQIHSQRHIKVQAMNGGYLQEIHVNEGQAVKKGDLMFKIIP